MFHEQAGCQPRFTLFQRKTSDFIHRRLLDWKIILQNSLNVG